MTNLSCPTPFAKPQGRATRSGWCLSLLAWTSCLCQPGLLVFVSRDFAPAPGSVAGKQRAEHRTSDFVHGAVNVWTFSSLPLPLGAHRGIAAD
jgi:hypothetical protein